LQPSSYSRCAKASAGSTRRSSVPCRTPPPQGVPPVEGGESYNCYERKKESYSYYERKGEREQAAANMYYIL